MKITLSVIKADIGGYVGHSESHPDIINRAQERLDKAKKDGMLIDCQATKCGDDLQLIMTHKKGTGDYEIHKLTWDTFFDGTELAKKMKLYGAGQNLLTDAFSGNVKGMGPGLAEMKFEERTAEPVLIFMADKTSAGAWNMHLYKIFADPFNTIGLVISPNMHTGYTFEVHDVKEHNKNRKQKQFKINYIRDILHHYLNHIVTLIMLWMGNIVLSELFKRITNPMCLIEYVEFNTILALLIINSLVIIAISIKTFASVFIETYFAIKSLIRNNCKKLK